MKKKILLGLGSLTAIVAPVASVVSCGTTKQSIPHLNKPTTVGSRHVNVALNLDTINIHPTVGTTEFYKLLNDSQEPAMAPITTKVKKAEQAITDASFSVYQDELVKAMQNMVNTFYDIGVVTTTYTITYKGVSNHFDVVSHFENLYDIDGINAAWVNQDRTAAAKAGEGTFTSMLEEGKQIWSEIITSQAYINFKNFVSTDHGKVVLMKSSEFAGLRELPLSANINQIADNLKAAIRFQKMMAGIM